MKLKSIILPLFLLLASVSFGQTYGNEWINYSQTYYTFEVVETGIHRIDYATLSASGIPISSFQPENIQIFGKEREIPLHIVDGGDNSLDPGDYILFYAERNDGWLDSTIYKNAVTIGNPGYSLVNDTLNYFFTWNNSSNNLRYSVETDVSFASYPSVADYVWYLFEKSYSLEYFDGERTSDLSSSFYTPGEGWGYYRKQGASGYTENLSITSPDPYTGAGAPDSRFMGRSVSASNAAPGGPGFNHHLQWEFGASNTLIMDTMWLGYGQARCNRTIPTSLITDGTTPLKWKIIGDLAVATDYQAYQYYSLYYPRISDISGVNELRFDVVNDPQGKIRIDITSPGASTPLMFVHGGDMPYMVPLTQNGGVHSVLIPNSTSGGKQEVIYQDSSLIIDVTTLERVTDNGQFTDFSTYNLEEAYIMIYHPELKNASVNYAAYRSADYNTLIANVEELYWQFGGGVRKHINGIRRFAHFVYNNSTVKPVGLFLMGKGIREGSLNIATSDGPGTRKNPERFAASLIPSFGLPSSDIAITAGLEGAYEWAPLMATGRISTRTDEELQGYLDKVIEYEIEQDPNSVYDTPNKDWQKHVLHFAGGSNTSEQLMFQNFMNQMENKISDSLFGGYVHRVYKTSSDPLDPTILAEVTDRISEGVSLMSYFGHSSGTNSGFEINLDDPTNWNNSKKYPVMLVNSCFNGNIFQFTNSKSEDFVQVTNYGAIAYMASVAVGSAYELNTYSQNLYQKLGKTHYGKTLGEAMKANVEEIEANPFYNSLGYETTCMQMVINGEPMLRLNSHERPEIELTPDDISFSPAVLDLTVDSLEMQINLTNLGRSITDTFEVRVSRSFPTQTPDSLYAFVFSKLDYTDTLRFKMPLLPNISIGQNTFNVSIDIPSVIDEQYEEITNNQITRHLYINIDGIVPVVPYEFAVVPDPDVTVKGSTMNPIADYNTYRFELDTVDFEGTVPQSSEYRYALVSGYGGVKEVNPSEWLSVATNNSMPLVCEDSVVYFWRVSVEGDTTWRESSFQYIPGKTGWGQDHFFQFKKNGFFNIGYDRVTRKRSFNPAVNQLTCDVLGATTLPAAYYNAFYINGNMLGYGIGTSMGPKIQVAVFDPITLEPWGRLDEFQPFSGNNIINQPYITFKHDNLAQLESFQDLVLNAVPGGVPDGHYLMIYTPMTTRYDQWNATDSIDMYATFAALGFDSIQPGNPNKSFCLFMKKGDPSTIVQVLSPSEGDDIQLQADIIGADDRGQEFSTLIGPASNWEKVYWKQDPEENPTADTTRLTIRAYDINGALQVTIDTLFSLNDSLENLNSLVDASLYPFIDLSAYYNDSIDYTPAQIDRWHVLYAPLPEAAIDGSTQHLWSVLNDTIQEGQDVEFAVDVRNIYNIDMDSLLVSYWVEDAYNVVHPIQYPRQDSLRVTDTLRDTISFSTLGLGGFNSFWMEVNPYINGSYVVTDQPEQQHFNNLLQIPFYVEPDDVNPILDVTFNGNHILNGDIVDPYGEVLITLKDDNEFLIMDQDSDTSLFGVYLTYPDGNQIKVPFVDGNLNTVMQWIPANSQNKRFKIIWPTELEMDGTYTLLVQGTDRSGNISGDIEYRVSFEVIHESTITHMMNYPNPFSTSTRFVFTLTGSEVPDDILIQIMTVSGRVVREINEDELGPIQIGRNITEFSWDGTDQFGDPLANGVYLYTVKSRINGEAIEHRESGADQYFKKEFGKMYLMR